MACWAEHLDCVEEVFDRPQSRECVHRVAELAAKNWEMYTQVRNYVAPVVAAICVSVMSGYISKYFFKALCSSNSCIYVLVPNTRAGRAGRYACTSPAVSASCRSGRNRVVATWLPYLPGHQGARGGQAPEHHP